MYTPIKIHWGKLNLPRHPFHPSVVYVENGWRGYSYWMAETPYPPYEVAPYRDRWELPCIHYSQNGLEWFTIDGNPIDDISENQIAEKAYLSDTHLLLNDNHLECYYRLYEHGGLHTVIYRKTSEDGEHWSDREVVADTENPDHRDSLGTSIISPALLHEDDTLRMWYVDDEPTNECRGISVGVWENGKWVKAVKCQLNSKVVPWHIDVQKHDGCYHLLVYDFGQSIHYYVSKDGIVWENEKKILQASNSWGDFFYKKLYRSCGVWIDKTYRVYFSASHGNDFSTIGVLEKVEDNSVKIIRGHIGLQNMCYLSHFAQEFIKHVFRVILKHIR